MMNDSLCRIIAGELQARAEQVEAAVRLLDEGNTVPFIARYRKEVTGGLDDTQLRNLETRLGYLRELEDRRQAILKSIAEQGKLTDALEKAINTTLSKTELEDLYLPYKPKRRTRGQIAIEAGLEPLADLLWNEPSHDPETEAAKYIDADKGVADSKAALDGARYILMERLPKTPRCWRRSVTICGKTPTWSPPSSAAKKRKAPNSATTSITMNRSPPCRRIARWRCSAVATKASCSSL
jgi:uncharacterized protein